MPILVDDSSPFGTYASGSIRRNFHASMNNIYKAGWVGRRLFGRLRWLERLCWSHTGGIADVERFGLRWRLYQRGNVADSRLLLRPDAFEPAEIGSILGVVDSGFTFIDVGANCGFYSLRIADGVAGFETGQVIAIEPHPGLRQRLVFNVSVNSALVIRILDCAVGDHNGTARLQVGERNLGQTRIAEQGTIDVEVRTLLDIVMAEKLERIDAIKVDVEGFEDRVLDPFFRHAPEFLLPRVVVAEHTWSSAWQSDWITCAVARGYREHDRTRQGNVILIRL